MNKIITIAISSVVGLALPVIGLTISPTRDILLGLPPDEAVLALADKIDENRVSSEQTDAKIMDLQSTIDNQSIELDNYRKQIDEQNNKIETVNIDNQEAQEKINKESECRKLYEENTECNHKNYQNKENFDKWMEIYKKMDENNNIKTNIYEKNYKEKKPIFDKCQAIIKQCN